MPTYNVTTCTTRLTQHVKQAIASEITRIHQEVTGARKFFAQVIFTQVAPDDFFIGGKPLQGDTLFVLGHIRNGRTTEQKDALIAQLIDGIAKASLLSRQSIWVYINELPPGQMAEFGHVLPAAGMEDAWLEDLPDADREYLARVSA